MRQKIAVAAPPYPASLQDGLHHVKQLSAQAAAAGAAIVCFPESYLPGYRGEGHKPELCSAAQLQDALEEVRIIAREQQIAIIIPMDWYEGKAFLNVAFAVDAAGEVLGCQSKNQLDPSEDAIWEPGTKRQVFETAGIRFGIVICHEGFRYPESVRLLARQGAQVVFHPNLTGSNDGTHQPKEWGSSSSPYYEKAQMVRALENTIYFAPSNYAFDYPESASAIIDPSGLCIAYQPYGKPGVAVAEIDTDRATGLLAKRLKPALYADAPAPEPSEL